MFKYLSQVLGATMDGSSVNRRLIKLSCDQTGSGLAYKTTNPFSREKRDFFFFFDPPHLIKTTRNCWYSKTRQLWVSVDEHVLQ